MKKRLLAVGLLLGLLVMLAVPLNVRAQEPASNITVTDKTGETDSSDGFTSDIYTTTAPLQAGTIVMVDPKNSTGVLAATQDKIEKAFGVVVSSNRLPLQLNISNSQVYVATSGRHQALVTSENGVIEAGDLLAISSLGGTLAKAADDQELVFAKALASFDGKNNTVGSYTLKDTTGRPIKQVGIGSIPIVITIIKNPELKSTTVALPAFLQRVGRAVAEKPVSPLRVYFGTAIVLLSVIAAIAILSSGIRSSIISIGRNPLSRKSIFRSLAQVVLTAVIILTIGMFTVYLLLKL
jgi:hypothetical protein